jgi:hypothetical protein
MVGTGFGSRRSVARSGLPVLGGVLAGGLALSVLYATTGLGVPCPFLALTGWQCPLCGGTRMGAALLRGDLAAAYAFNPLALIALGALAALGAVWAVEVLGGPAIRPPGKVTSWAQRVPAVCWAVLVLLIAAGYTVFRNL